MTEQHTAKRLDDGVYEYRGFQIWRNDNVTSGYWGRWAVWVGKNSRSFETLKDAKKYVDSLKTA